MGIGRHFANVFQAAGIPPLTPPFAREGNRLVIIFAVLALLLTRGEAQAALDLSKASVTRLDNGLTLIVLEDRAFPVVSVQATYKAGAKYDPRGKMGLAHFVEHMAFRQSKNFPGTSLASSIYAVGGEWHGYTWIDTTNYYATVPRDDLDLLLRIESDRMGRLKLAAGDVEAESGAVIAEMKGYENDPSSILYDALLASAFEVHPYRLNTIGYEAGVKAITRDDIAAFYKAHYVPSNAVIAVVGDVDARAVAKAAQKHFGDISSGAPTPLPPDSEPKQTGERRIQLEGETDKKLFKIAYPAPAARSDDFAAFLILEDLAGAGSGVNFDQNSWGDPVRASSALAGVAKDATTFFIPTAEPYVFVVSGSIVATADEKALEDAVQKRLSTLQTRVSAAAVAAARARVLKALAFDVETTEDAAHQLAAFEGIGALDQLFHLKQRLAAVTAADIERVAKLYLDPRRRTIGWMVPKGAALPALASHHEALARSKPRDGDIADAAPVSAPMTATLKSGLPAAIQASPLSPTASLKIVVPGAIKSAASEAEIWNDYPAPDYSTIAVDDLADNFEGMVSAAAAALKNVSFDETANAAPSNNPLTRLRQIFSRIIGARILAQGAPAPLFVAASGNLDKAKAKNALEKAFGAMAPADEIIAPAVTTVKDVTETIPEPKAQAALGYIVGAPGGDDAASLRWRIVLYILAHDYGGRLGEEAISKRGLLYYIGADYCLDRKAGWVTLSMGVNPEKLAPLTALLKEELKGLADNPPSDAEIAEAKRWIMGRKESAAIGNSEITNAFVRDFVAYGAIQSPNELKAALDAVTRKDIINMIPAFASGAVITVNVGARRGEGEE